MAEAPRETLRLDRWLTHARFARTRTVAAALVEGGKVRVNGEKVRKPAFAVGAGDTLTLVRRGEVRVIRITGLPERRGPATEAQGFWQEVGTDPPDPAQEGM